MVNDLIRLLIWLAIGVAGGLFIYIMGLILFLYGNMQAEKISSENNKEHIL